MNAVSITPPAAMLMSDNPALSVPTGKSVEMAQQFESLILSQLLKQMRSTSEEGGMFPGDKSDTYGGMFDMYFGQFLAEKGGLGLTEFVSKQLEDQTTHPTESSEAGVAAAGFEQGTGQTGIE